MFNEEGVGMGKYLALRIMTVQQSKRAVWHVA
jgi:hypothetical protein